MARELTQTPFLLPLAAAAGRVGVSEKTMYYWGRNGRVETITKDGATLYDTRTAPEPQVEFNRYVSIPPANVRALSALWRRSVMSSMQLARFLYVNERRSRALLETLRANRWAVRCKEGDPRLRDGANGFGRPLYEITNVGCQVLADAGEAPYIAPVWRSPVGVNELAHYLDLVDIESQLRDVGVLQAAPLGFIFPHEVFSPQEAAKRAASDPHTRFRRGIQADCEVEIQGERVLIELDRKHYRQKVIHEKILHLARTSKLVLLTASEKRAETLRSFARAPQITRHTELALRVSVRSVEALVEGCGLLPLVNPDEWIQEALITPRVPRSAEVAA